MALKAAMQRRAGQMWESRLQSVETVVERQQVVRSGGDHDRLLFNGQDGRSWLLRPGPQIGD
jgi:hypothetical protein